MGKAEVQNTQPRPNLPTPKDLLVLQEENPGIRRRNSPKETPEEMQHKKSNIQDTGTQRPTARKAAALNMGTSTK